ncbi:MAG: hypothetical protein WBG70_23680 [Spirulinaceae cyanobacterium]
MTIVENYFDELEFWDTAFFSNPQIREQTITIDVKNFKVYEDHPLNNSESPLILPSGKIIFRSVVSSKRKIYKYYLASNGEEKCKPRYEIVDSPFLEQNNSVEMYVLEGVLENPYAWI